MLIKFGKLLKSFKALVIVKFNYFHNFLNCKMMFNQVEKE